MSKPPDLFSKTVKRGPSLTELAKALDIANPFESKRRKKPTPGEKIAGVPEPGSSLERDMTAEEIGWVKELARRIDKAIAKGAKK